MIIETKLPDGKTVEVEFPDGTPQNIIEQALRQSLPADNLSWGDTLSQAVSNTPESAGRFASDLWDMITNPVETAEGIGKTVAGYAQKAVGYDGEYAQYADALNDYFSNKYGGIENFKRSLASDPVGVLGDVSTIFTGGAGAARAMGKAASIAGKTGRAASVANKIADIGMTAGKYTDPLVLGAKAISAPTSGVASLLGLTPEKMYASALKPPTTLDVGERGSIIKTGLSEGIVPNARGVDKLNSKISGLGKQAEDIIAARTALEESGALPKTIDPELIGKNALSDSYSGVHGNTVDPFQALNTSNATVGNFLDAHGRGGNMSTARAQKIKQNTYKAISDSYDKLSAPKRETHKALARGLKDGIAANVPEVIPYNNRMEQLFDLKPILDRSASRIENQNMISLRGLLSGSAAMGGGAGMGAAVGGVPGALVGGAVGSLLLHPTNQARAAIGMHKVANSPITKGAGQAASWGAIPARFGRTFQATDAPTIPYGGLLGMIGQE